MIFLLLMIILLVGFSLFKRYVPAGHPYTSELSYKDVILDVRDYQITFKDPVDGAIQIPYGYLKRYYKEIPHKNIVIMAGDLIEKNLAIRFLHKRGYQVKGFIIINEKRKSSNQCLNKCLQ